MKQIAWNIFKETGDINAYLEFVEIREIEENKGSINETSKGKWNSNIRK